MAAAAIPPVASQPSHNTGPDTVKRPITLVLTAISMSSVITGTLDRYDLQSLACATQISWWVRKHSAVDRGGLFGAVLHAPVLRGRVIRRKTNF